MLSVVLGTNDDFEDYYKLKCEKSSVYWSGYECAPDYDRLKEHFKKLISDDMTEAKIYFVKDNSNNVGYFQLVYISEREVEVSVGVCEAERGKGYGTFAIAAALKTCKEENENISVICYIREDNIASQMSFEKNGFVKQNSYKENYFPLENRNIKMYLYVDANSASLYV